MAIRLFRGPIGKNEKPHILFVGNVGKPFLHIPSIHDVIAYIRIFDDASGFEAYDGTLDIQDEHVAKGIGANYRKDVLPYILKIVQCEYRYIFHRSLDQLDCLLVETQGNQMAYVDWLALRTWFGHPLAPMLLELFADPWKADLWEVFQDAWEGDCK
jgi:hypothetical protein